MRLHHLEGEQVKKHKPKLKKLLSNADKLKVDIIKAKAKLLAEQNLSRPKTHCYYTPLTEVEIRALSAVIDDPVEVKKLIRKINRKPKVKCG